MFVLTLGSQASASTWLFNAARALFERAGAPFFSLSADDGIDALDQMPLHVGNVLVKAHSMDQRLIRLARLAQARLIVSTRDPLDSMVSQNERFGLSPQLAAVDLTRSFASIASLPHDLPQLCLRYEQGFTRDRDTIGQIARFLDLPLSDDQSAAIFGSLLPAAVQSRIDAHADASPGHGATAADPVTHWHPGHIGDGRVGKWRERLDPETRDMIGGCLSAMASPPRWQCEKLHWSGSLFRYDGGQSEAPTVDLVCDGSGRSLVHGPYLHLPRGRWRAIPFVESTTSLRRKVHLGADVHRPASGAAPIERQGRVGRGISDALAIAFDHPDHFQPVEVRLRSIAGARGSIRFSGCALQWIGPL